MPISTNSKRLQLTIPYSDKTVIDWTEKQNSVSVSVRAVIKDYVARHGMTDAACQSMMIVDNSREIASNDVETLAYEHNDSTDTAVENVFKSENASEMSSDVQTEYERTALNSSEETFDEFRPVIDEVHFEEGRDVVKDKPVLSPTEFFLRHFGCTVDEFDKMYSDYHNPPIEVDESDTCNSVSSCDAADSTSDISQ